MWVIMSLFWSNRSKMVHDSVWFIWTVHSLIESFEVVSHIMAYRILDGWLGYLPTIWCLLLLRSETQPEKESQIITQPVVSWTTNQQKSYYIKSKFLSLFFKFFRMWTMSFSMCCDQRHFYQWNTAVHQWSIIAKFLSDDGNYCILTWE